MDTTEQLRNEILAVMWRYSQESDVSVIDTIDEQCGHDWNPKFDN